MGQDTLIRARGEIREWKRKSGYGWVEVGDRTYWAHKKHFKRAVNEDQLIPGAVLVFTYKPDERVSKGFPAAYEIVLEGQ